MVILKCYFSGELIASFYRDCLSILMLLHIMPAYLMLSVALFNAVCLRSAHFLRLTFVNAFCFHALSWVIDTVCLFQILSCIMHSAFNLLAFLILCSHRFLMKGLCALWRNTT